MVHSHTMGVQILHNYEVTSLLGTGSFSCVKLGTHKSTKREVAVKICKKTSNPTSILNEIAIGKKLGSHKNIAGFIEAFTVDGSTCLIFEKVCGSDLFSLLESSPSGGLTEEDMKKLFLQIVQGLGYAHSCGIVHRDIKPENVLVDSNDYTVKIIDWGLGSIVQPNQTLSSHVGSIEYCAPEILLGKPYDGIKADCWSLGVLLYVSLTGLFPWLGKTQQEVVRQIIKANYYPLLSASKELTDLLSHLLVVDPALRYDTQQILEHPWFSSQYA